MAKNAFTRALSTPTPQKEREDPTQVKNNAGGYVFQTSDEIRLQRFLILGIDGGTYYQKEVPLAKQNLQFLKDLIASNEELVWDIVREISDSGRAYKNSPAIFALAYLFKYGKIKDGPQEVAEKSAKRLHATVVRTPSHLWEFEGYAKILGVSGRAIRSARASFYLRKSADELAYHAVKYRQRDGWTHRDTMRLGHPRGINQSVGSFILGKDQTTAATPDAAPAIIRGFKFAQEAQTASELINLALTEYPNLPWEAIPTQFHKNPEVWKKLFYNGQLNGQALVRNITRLARIGAFNDMVFARDYANKLTDVAMIRKTRLHPIQYLLALTIHQNGQIPGQIRKTGYADAHNRMIDWATSPVIVDALNEGYYASFKNIEPSNKRFFLGIDVSGSMSSAMSSGIDLTCAEGAAAMAMAIARTEPYYMVRGFTSGAYGYRYNAQTELTDLGITPNMNLSDVLRNTRNNNFGGTDCSLPMLWAAKNKIEVDLFGVITDNETWAGRVHPHRALEDYRQTMGRDAKLVVVGMTATPFTIADPKDPGMLDVVGMDTNVPAIISDFAAGRL